MEKDYIDLLWESKDNLKLIDDREVHINFENAMKHINELNELNDYVPILLKSFLEPNYITRQDKKVKDQFMKAYSIHQIVDFSLLFEFLNKDLLGWLEKYPQFKDIIE